ncbi:hypothetical protein [Wolbachia endosymbiont of Ctenocephalides felis wCfeJ]|nr:hypothetical protein [Wolbachia endosymbiont of Ctenocephalides felis wCfeJ]
MTSLGHSDDIHNPVIPALVHFLKVSFQCLTLESSLIFIFTQNRK